MEELNVKEMKEINGGGVGGFIIGFMAGTTVAYVGIPILCAMGKTEDEIQAFMYSSMVTGGAIGAMFTGPV